MSKYIALIDCDSFFCSCEQKMNTQLKGKAICVVSGDRGCVIARSVEAKKLGVPMGIPLFMAQKQFPKCIYINANHKLYSTVSKQIMSILKDFSPNVEVYSIDEAFVDLTGLTKLYKKNYYDLALFIKNRIKEEVDIPVSIGISRTKTLAKLASDHSKTTSSHIILVGERHILKYLEKTKIDDIWGIGHRLKVKLAKFGIITPLEYVSKSDKWIEMNFGKNGLATKQELLGKIAIPLSCEYELPKSISDSKSFTEFTSDINYLKNELMIHIHRTCTKLRSINCKCATIGVIIKTKDFRVFYEKLRLPECSNFEIYISNFAFQILEKYYSPQILYRSIGIVLEEFSNVNEEQLTLFSNNQKKEKQEKLGQALDNISNRFGSNAIKVGYTTKEIPIKQDFLTHPKFD